METIEACESKGGIIFGYCLAEGGCEGTGNENSDSIV